MSQMKQVCYYRSATPDEKSNPALRQRAGEPIRDAATSGT